MDHSEMPTDPKVTPEPKSTAAKNGKTGLVIPTQEKNLRAEMDEKRVKELLGREYAPLG